VVFCGGEEQLRDWSDIALVFKSGDASLLLCVGGFEAHWQGGEGEGTAEQRVSSRQPQ
jgi:hypothetical protein